AGVAARAARTAVGARSRWRGTVPALTLTALEDPDPERLAGEAGVAERSHQGAAARDHEGARGRQRDGGGGGQRGAGVRSAVAADDHVDVDVAAHVLDVADDVLDRELQGAHVATARVV